MREYRIGVIADTHGLVRPEAARALDGSELIIHAGDVGRPEVLEALRKIAPVAAVRGNVDRDDWAAVLPVTEGVRVGEAFLYVLHDLNDLDVIPTGFAAVISGHTHHPLVERRRGVLYLNPGSAGPRRFSLPITLASMIVRGAEVEATIIELPG